MKIVYLSLIALIIASCATHTQKLNKEHNSFLRDVQVKKSSLPKKNYRKFLKDTIRAKEDEIIGLRALKNRESTMISQNDTRATQQPEDIYTFHSQTHAMSWQQLDDREKMLRKQLFFLRSQLSSL